MKGKYFIEVDFESESGMDENSEVVPMYIAEFDGYLNKFEDNEYEIELSAIFDEYGNQVKFSRFTDNEINELYEKAYDKLSLGKCSFEEYEDYYGDDF